MSNPQKTPLCRLVFYSRLPFEPCCGTCANDLSFRQHRHRPYVLPQKLHKSCEGSEGQEDAKKGTQLQVCPDHAALLQTHLCWYLDAWFCPLLDRNKLVIPAEFTRVSNGLGSRDAGYNPLLSF